VRLEWVPSYLAKTYTISRSNVENDGYRTVAADVAAPIFIDRRLIANQSYFYRVAPAGMEHAPRQIGITAGLPRNWSEHSYGDAFPPGSTDVASDVFRVQAYGTHPFGHSDELHFVHSTLTGDGILTACFNPLLASQVATVGLMLREEKKVDNPMVALSVSASSGGERR